MLVFDPRSREHKAHAVSEDANPVKPSFPENWARGLFLPDINLPRHPDGEATMACISSSTQKKGERHLDRCQDCGLPPKGRGFIGDLHACGVSESQFGLLGAVG